MKTVTYCIHLVFEPSVVNTVIDVLAAIMLQAHIDNRPAFIGDLFLFFSFIVIYFSFIEKSEKREEEEEEESPTRKR